MKRSVSPLFAVIMVVLVLIIAGLLWYIFSTPKAGPGGPGIALPAAPKPGAAATPAEKAQLKTVTEKAAEAKSKLGAEMKATEKPAAPAKAPQPEKAAPAPAAPKAGGG